MEKMTMQKFADTFGVYVAMDERGGVFAYTQKPKIEGLHNFWSNELRETQPIEMFIIPSKGLNWRSSLCSPSFKYRPYSSPSLEWLGKIIKNKERGYVISIESVGEDFIETEGGDVTCFADMFEVFEWEDGTPCGVCGE